MSGPEYFQYRSTPDEHLYKNAAVPYYRRPDLMVMFPKRFLPERVFDPDWPHVYMDPRGNEPDCSSMVVPGITWIYGCAGLSDIVFMFSRDGIRFTHFQEAFIRPGRDIRNWHGRAVEVGPTLVSTGDLVSPQFHWAPKGGNYCPPFFRSPERSFLHVSSGVRRLETATSIFF